MRPLEELRDVDDPAWPLIQAAIADATCRVDVLPVDPVIGGQTLHALQVSAGSVLGALALHTGGLLVDDRWLRVLGGGETAMNLAHANDLLDGTGSAGRLVVAVDVLGGTFAVNGGALPGEHGEVCYFAPDELAWLPMEMGHGAFVDWSLTHELATFYEHLRWAGWREEVRSLGADEGLSLYPFPFTAEGRDLDAVSRRPAPIADIAALWEDLARQLHRDPPEVTP